MIKTLAAQVKEFKKDSLLTPIFVILEVLMDIAIPLMMARIIDEGIQKNDMHAVVVTGLIMIGMALLSLLFGVLAGKFAASASTGFARNLRKAMFENIQNFSFSNIDKYSTAGLVTRMTTDVTNLQNAYQMIIRLFVRAPFMMIFAMIMVFKINAKLSLVFLCAIVVLGFVIGTIMIKAHPKFERVFRKYDDLNASVQENVNAIRVVKAYVREDYENKKFKTASGNLYKMFVNVEKLIICNMPVMQFVVYACILIISWLGAKFIVAGNMTTGELTSMFSYTMNILMSLMMLSMVLLMVIMSRASAERIAEVINEKSDLNNGDNPLMEVPDGSVEFKDVNFSYKKDKNYVLENVDLFVKSGETIGIIGGTGSSKSSLVQLIPRLYDVTTGAVCVGGHDVREYDIETLRNEVAMVLQKNVLFSGTIKENLRWGNPDATDEEIIHACKQSQADEFIQTFPDGYDTYIEQGGTNVSGGQKQRLCIARALLKKPKILIFDDSTSAVDTKTDAMIRKAFREDIPDTTKFIIAQRISSVQDADRIIVLNEGQVVDFGSHDQLMQTSEIYRDVYESQMKGVDENAKTK